MPLVLHRWHLGPLIFSHLVFLDRAESLLAGKSTQNVHITLANSYGVRVSAFIHRCFICYFILHCKVKSSVLFRGRSSARNQDFLGVQRYSRRTLVKLVRLCIIQFFLTPFVFVYVIAERYFLVNVVSEKINSRLVVLILLL